MVRLQVMNPRLKEFFDNKDAEIAWADFVLDKLKREILVCAHSKMTAPRHVRSVARTALPTTPGRARLLFRISRFGVFQQGGFQ